MDWNNITSSYAGIGEYAGILLKPYGFKYIPPTASIGGLVAGHWLMYEGSIEEFKLFMKTSIEQSTPILGLELAMHEGVHESEFSKEIEYKVYYSVITDNHYLFHLYGWTPNFNHWQYIDISISYYGNTVAGKINLYPELVSGIGRREMKDTLYLFTPIDLIPNPYYMNWLDGNPLEVKG